MTSFEPRPRKQLLAELEARAKLWMPERRADSSAGAAARSDPTAALLAIAAKLGSEVTQRLSRVPEKSYRGMLHWLGRRGRPGRPARVPVSFRLQPAALPVVAPATSLLQADAGGTAVVFETERPILLVPSTLEAVVAAVPAEDAFFEAFPGLASLDAPTPSPADWRLRVAAATGAREVQLDPPEGIAAGMALGDDAGNRYRVEAVKDGIVTIAPGIASGPYAGQLHRVAAFSPFDRRERDLQEHALYLGADAALDISTPAEITLTGDTLPAACKWHYWGKRPGDADSDWRELPMLPGHSDVLVKGPGEIEPREIGGTRLRWLRATPADPPPNQPATPIRQTGVHGLRLKINCGPDEQAKQPASAGGRPVIEMEAIANTTPVVLDRGFYPFGRQPRIFDAFHLSCPEAFGKPNARATIHFSLDDSISAPMIAVWTDSALVAAGVGADGKLHFLEDRADPAEPAHHFRFTEPSRPLDAAGHPVALPPQRPGAALLAATATGCFSVTDGTAVWLWRSPPGLKGRTGEPERWTSFGAPKDAGVLVETILAIESGAPLIYALTAAGTLHARPADGGDWTVVPVMIDGKPQPLHRLAAIETADGPGAETQGLAGVTDAGRLVYRRAGAWGGIDGFLTDSTQPERGAQPATTAPYPLAVAWPGNLDLYVRGKAGSTAAFRIADGSLPVSRSAAVADLAGGGFGWQPRKGGDPLVVFATRAGAPRLWLPFVAGEPIDLKLPVPALPVEWPPLRIGGDYLLPLERRAASAMAGPRMEAATTASAMGGIALIEALPGTAPNSVLLEMPGPLPRFAVGTRVGTLGYAFPDATPTVASAVAGSVHRIGPRRACKVGNPRTTVDLAPDDADTRKGSTLAIRHGAGSWALFTVTNLDTGSRIATLDAAVPGTAKRRPYLVVQSSVPTTFDLRPTVVLEGAIETGAGACFVLSGGKLAPVEQHVAEAANERLVLGQGWGTPFPKPGAPVEVASAALIAPPELPPAARNPELSWEYWNGASWWQIPGVEDTTLNLVKTGKVRFCVPTDLKSTSVAGRDGTWVRARLVGGDYGEEIVRIGADNKTVERDTSGIHAPYVASIDVTYSLCCAIAPDRVLTLDSGALLDQTAVNLTPNAVVAVFTPLAAAGTAPPPEAAPPAHACCPPPAKAASAADLPVTVPADREPAIFLGFSHPLKGTGIAILFRLAERPETGERPLRIDGFTAGAFRPLQVDDETRGLTRTGVVTLDCPAQLQQVSLFGRPLHWLRLRAPEGTDGWSPQIAGVHLNTVWAVAAETRTLEQVGGSDGSPFQSFPLAHAPVIDGSLSLWVREPLGEDEIPAVANAGHAVLDALGEWKGPWVEWALGDPTMAGAGERVFGLDSATGMLGFGNGAQGAIPPISTDGIVARRYRSGGGAVGNSVAAWSPLNLVTPLAGVEATVAVLDAAGGTDPQDAPAALRFASANLAMRDRAVTLRDFELQALQLTPGIAQARAFRTARGVTLVAVMAGRDPRPSNEARGALACQLAEIAVPELRRPGALLIEGPQVVRLDVAVEIEVADLAAAAAVAEAVKAAVAALLDPATGGVEGRGWPLGAMPGETDVAAIVERLPKVEALLAVEIARADGTAAVLASRALATLAEGGALVTCQPVAVEAE